jgi:hypothetical protein
VSIGKRLFGDLDFNSNQALRARLENVAADPSPLTASDIGRMWFNTTEGNAKLYNGVATVTLGAGYIKVRCATTGAIAVAGVSVSGLDVNSSIDGVTLQAGDLVLVKDQDGTFYGSGPSDNGVYIVVATQNMPTRYALMNAPSEFNGALVLVEEGTVNADTAWMCTSVDPIPGGEPIIFERIGAGTAVSVYADYTAATSGSINTANADMMQVSAYELVAGKWREVGILSEYAAGVVSWSCEVPFSGRVVCSAVVF